MFFYVTFLTKSCTIYLIIAVNLAPKKLGKTGGTSMTLNLSVSEKEELKPRITVLELVEPVETRSTT